MISFLAIHAKGGESISPKQKDLTTTNFKILVFQEVFSNWYTLLNTKRRISLRGSFVQSKEKHLKQGEKTSNLEKASQNLIHIPLTICKKTLKRISKTLQNKTSGASVVQNFKLEESHPCISGRNNYWFHSKQPLHLHYANQFNSVLIYLLWFVLASITKKGILKGKQGQTFS